MVPIEVLTVVPFEVIEVVSEVPIEVLTEVVPVALFEVLTEVLTEDVQQDLNEKGLYGCSVVRKYWMGMTLSFFLYCPVQLPVILEHCFHLKFCFEEELLLNSSGERS